MGIKQTLDVINAMLADGVIGRYAIAGAVAAYNYIEPAVTQDLDILVSFDEAATGPSGLITLAPIFDYLAVKGYVEHRQEGILIEGWPVQFLPVASDLDKEALAQAVAVDVQIGASTVGTHVLRPEHIVATLLRVGRPQDYVRIAQFVDEDAVDLSTLCRLLERHALTGAWRSFCMRTGISDPCAVNRG